MANDGFLKSYSQTNSPGIFNPFLLCVEWEYFYISRKHTRWATCSFLSIEVHKLHCIYVYIVAHIDKL